METILMDGLSWRRRVFAFMQGQHPSSVWGHFGLTPLWLASCVYGGIIAAHHASYTRGIRRRQRLPCRVISIGNLTLGGTGKTPLTLWVARWLQKQGWRVAVLSRGYGASSGALCRVVSAGDGPLMDWRTAGDEPYLLAQNLPGVPVLVAPDRYLGGRYACEQFDAQVVILDDGFQHVALHRDLDIVLIDASNPFGHGSLVPRGILREPVRALRRADAIVLTRAEMARTTLPRLHEHIRRRNAPQPIYAMTMVAEAWLQEGTGILEDPGRLHRQRSMAFAGIGNPQSFAAALARLDIDVTALLVFPDHHPYTEDDWRRIVDIARQRRAACLITTEKDAVRLLPDWQAPIPLYVLRIGVRFVAGAADFEQHLYSLMEHA